VTHLERLRQVVSGEAPPPPIATFVGFRLVEVEEGRSVLEFEAEPRHWNPQGTLHGGIMCDVADAAMGIAYASTLPEEVSFTTIELKINFLRPVIVGPLKAVGHVVKAGRTIGLTECDLTDAEGRLVARASSTCMTLQPRAADPPAE
jgi:uncharacterized protein (TIGR00369 family)